MQEPRLIEEPVRRYHWIVLVSHWSAFILIFGMIASGLQIYRVYPHFGETGGPLFPNAFQDAAFPLWARLGGEMARGDSTAEMQLLKKKM